MAKKNRAIPSYDDLIIPSLKALIALGGSGSIDEINQKVYEIAQITEDVLSISHKDNGEGRSEVDYRLAWSRTYLKKYGLIENSSRGIWALVNALVDPTQFKAVDIVRSVREQTKNQTNQQTVGTDEVDREVEATEEWKDKLLQSLYELTPAAFERLAQRILRESGFSQVEVTGKAGDGGIDGKGIIRMSGLLSFHVIFQCKRYKGSVTPSQIRDFRGAMQGRADKGLFLTTGTFTREATKEATRDGAPPIDLIDGESLCDKLKELKLGVETQMVEMVGVKTEWFNNL